MTAVLGLSPPQKSTKMAAHNRLMEREWGFGYLVSILAHHQLENLGMLSGELSVEFALQESEMKGSPWRWEQFWLHSEFQASLCYRVRPWLNKIKQSKKKYFGSALVAQKNVLFLRETGSTGMFFFWWGEVILLFHETCGNHYSLVRS